MIHTRVAAPPSGSTATMEAGWIRTVIGFALWAAGTWGPKATIDFHRTDYIAELPAALAKARR